MGGSLNANFFDLIPGQLPDIFMETGTYQGDTCIGVYDIFKTILTCEMSDANLAIALEKLRSYPEIRIFKEDSLKFLTRLPLINQPICFYLDAHWDGGGDYNPHGYQGSVDVPLLQELEVIAKHPYPDLVICDDVRLFEVWQQPDWTGISIKKCLEAVGKHKWYMVYDDRLIIQREV